MRASSRWLSASLLLGAGSGACGLNAGGQSPGDGGAGDVTVFDVSLDRGRIVAADAGDSAGRVKRDATADVESDRGVPVDAAPEADGASDVMEEVAIDSAVEAGRDTGVDAPPACIALGEAGTAASCCSRAANGAGTCCALAGTPGDRATCCSGATSGSVCCTPDQMNDEANASNCCSGFADGTGTCCQPNASKSACCIANSQADNGSSGNCCTGTEYGGTCGCIGYMAGDNGNPANCCAGAVSTGSTCGCIAAGQNFQGSHSNCCSGMASTSTCCLDVATSAGGNKALCCTGKTDPGGNCCGMGAMCN